MSLSDKKIDGSSEYLFDPTKVRSNAYFGNHEENISKYSRKEKINRERISNKGSETVKKYKNKRKR